MKSLTFALILAALAAVGSGYAQTATDDAVAALSPIKRPTKSTPAPANNASGKPASGPKKPLEATLSADENGKGNQTSFAASTPKIYLHYTDESATKGDKLRAVWIAEDAKGFATKNKKLTEVSQTMPGPGVNGKFYLPATANGFPVGKYRAELYENGKLAKSLKFTVK